MLIIIGGFGFYGNFSAGVIGLALNNVFRQALPRRTKIGALQEINPA